MGVMAKWGSKTWEVSAKKIVALEGLAFNYTQMADENNATEEKKTVNKRGIELFSVSFSTVLVAGTGVDIWDEIQSWKSLVTKVNYFYLNGKKLFPKLLQLRQVGVSEVRLDNQGRIRMAKLSFTLKEYDPDTTSVKVSTSAIKVTADAGAKKAKRTGNTKLKKSVTVGVKVGSYVRLLGTEYENGTIISDKMKQRGHTVEKISGDRVMIHSDDGYNWVNKNDITLM